jgi:Zn-dependent protease/predicted transcriptional regulator
MNWSFSLGRVKGIDIRVHATFVLVLIWAAFYWGVLLDGGRHGAIFGVVATLLLFACVLLHELAHSLVAQRYGIRTRSITLLPIGGVASLERIPQQPAQEIRISAAGPLVNLAIAAVLIGIGAILNATSLVTPAHLLDDLRDAEWGGLLPYLIAANLSLAIFNLLPAFPLDGGRIFRALLATRLDYRRATEIAVAVGKVLALGFGLVGIFSTDVFLILIAVFIWYGADAEGRQVTTRSVFGDVTVGQAMSRRPAVLAQGDPLAHAVELTLTTSQADFPVVGPHGGIVGLLTADDLLRALRDQPATTVGAVMRRDFPRAVATEPLADAQQRVAASRVNALPVVDGDHLAGLLTAADIGEAYRLLSIQPDLLRGRRIATA